MYFICLLQVNFYVRLPLLLDRSRFMLAQDPLKLSTDGGIVEQLTSTQTLSLTSLKQFSKQHGLRIHSILLAINGGVIRRYLEASGKPIPDFITIPIPQLLPDRPRFLIGNHFNTIFVPVPLVQHRTILERVRDIETRILEINSTKMDLMHTHTTVRMASVLPFKFWKYMILSGTVRVSISPLLFPDGCRYQSRKATPMHPIVGITTPIQGNCRMRSLAD